MKIVKYLITVDGISEEQATDAVLTYLSESHDYLVNQEYDHVIMGLRMAFTGNLTEPELIT